MDRRFELHCQTHFSIGKSIIDPKRLPEVAAGKGLAGIAVTDYFNVDGWIEAYYMMQHCTDKNMRLIYGAAICIRDDIHKAVKEKFFDCYATVLVKNDIGRRNLFRILSMKATKYAGRDIENGWIYLSDLDKCREGLLIGWNCDNAYLHQDYGEDEENWNRKKLEQTSDTFDYYEIAPFSYHPLFPIEPVGSKDMTEWVMEFAQKHNRPLIAVSAAKYLDREENTEWKMLQDYSYHNGETGCLEQDVTAHLRSAGEMMELFSFLGNKKAREIVIDNPKMLVEQIELHEPFLNDRIYPDVDGGSQTLRAIVFSNAKKCMGRFFRQRYRYG